MSVASIDKSTASAILLDIGCTNIIKIFVIFLINANPRGVIFKAHLIFYFIFPSILYCIALYCIVLYCIVLFCIALYRILLYCIFYTVLYCIVFVLYCIVSNFIVLYCLYCIVLYCIVFYCTVCN